MNFTPNQQAAIHLRKKNILVSAAAGSGKTAVLVERIVGMVCEGADIDRILVLTFTNLAAAEMRERIGHRLAERLGKEPENAHLIRQMTLLHNAQITTIDSFCLFILRNHFHAIDLDPAFRVADEGELRLLKKEVMADMLEEHYAQNPPGFLATVEYFTTGASDGVMEEHIAALYQMALSFPWPQEWLLERKGDYATTQFTESTLMDYLLSYGAHMLTACISELDKALRLCDADGGPYMYAATIAEELQMLFNFNAGLGVLHAATGGPEAAPQDKDALYDYYVSKWPDLCFARLPGKRDESVSAAAREAVRQLRDGVKGAIKECGERFFSLPLATVLARMEHIQPAASVLIDLACDFMRRMDNEKREKNIVDFSDMEHFTLQILWDKSDQTLTPSAVAQQMREHFIEVMCDEYQDSNFVQELLLESVSRDNNRFMVGDVKQSIYKFRLARPEIFMEKYAAYAPWDAEPSTQGCPKTRIYARHCGLDPQSIPQNSDILRERLRLGGRNDEFTDCLHHARITLNQNFRSRPGVLSAVNFIFSHIMQAKVGGIDYTPEVMLYPGMDYPANNADNRAELLLIENGDNEGDDEGEPAEEMGPGDDKALEARFIASRIRELMKSYKIRDRASGELRPLAFRDIVILLRSAKGWDDTFKNVLLEEGILATTSARSGYFAATEIQTILQLLAILDNPHQDIPLFAVMKSYFAAFSDEEIALIRAWGRDSAAENDDKPDGSLYDELTELVNGTAIIPSPHSVIPQIFNAESPVLETPSSPPTLHEKITRFLTFIDTFREKAVYTPIAELLRELIIDSGYYHEAAVRPGGGQRGANLDMLLQKAASFAESSYHGLFHFVRYIEQLEKYEVDYGEASLIGDEADVVRIMSIHKSKGLEFPVCFIAGLHKKINLRDSHAALCLDVDLGMGMDFMDTDLRLLRKSLRKSVISEKIKLDSLGEELRILYVAMTRAQEKLILTGMVKELPAGIPGTATATPETATDHQPHKAQQPSFLQLTKAGSYLKLLLPLITSCEAADHFAVRGYKAGDLEAKLVSEMIDLKQRRDDLLATIIDNKDADSLLHSQMTQLSEKFKRAYPFANLADLYAKTTVSELKKADNVTGVIDSVIAASADGGGGLFDKPLFSEPEITPYIPSFIRDKAADSGGPISGAERGSAYHKVMEVINWGAFAGLLETDAKTGCGPGFADRLMELLNAQIMAATESGRLPAAYAAAVPLEKIAAFLGAGPNLHPDIVDHSSQYGRHAESPARLLSPLARRMIAADQAGKLYKEQPFVIGIDAARLNPALPADETILIQGIIDLYFSEDDGLTIVDYKSDAVTDGAELISRYKTQLDHYQAALTQLTALPVKEKIIYSFALGAVIYLE